MPESDKPFNDYVALVALMRAEIEAAIKPMSDDIHELKEQSYSREMLDKMFQLRDERISRITSIGSWVVGASGVIYVILIALQMFGVIK